MYTGMQLENREAFTHLIVESDSKLNIAFKHTWREGNRCSNWLTNFSFNKSSYDVRILESPPMKI